jgi:parallel beta-helix repeat protein
MRPSVRRQGMDGAGWVPRVIAALLLMMLIPAGDPAAHVAAGTAPGIANPPPHGPPLPEVVVRADNVRITESCRIVVPPDVVVADADNNGVVHIVAPDVIVDFDRQARLSGSAEAAPPDAYTGCAVRIDGQRGVTVRGLRARGYRAGIWASGCDGLTVEDCDLSDQWRARLHSTPEAEASRDWLSPHENDANEWLARYGAAIYIEDATGVTVRRCRVQHGQNGLILDRVDDSRVYDNDFSFNSGWGIALWRSSRNVISRNACDFCVRGYSHGVYNRGQDSAGILIFEQCGDNLIVENSATHGGDGVFGFAGREALGEAPPPDDDFDCARRGCNDNTFVGNDFSYAAAHGIEMTFSFGNRIEDNRVVGNAICGVWAGYCQDTLIVYNEFADNGEAGYGLERGGVNIEHGRGNRILRNDFRGNTCGVHLWWDADEVIAQLPWVKANGAASTDNLIAWNDFHDESVAVHLRGSGDVLVSRNKYFDVDTMLHKDDEHSVYRSSKAGGPGVKRLSLEVPGQTRPVGARARLRGRANIIMTEWGPWDHATTLVRPLVTRGRTPRYELRQMPGDVSVELDGEHVTGSLVDLGERQEYRVQATTDGVWPYTLRIRAGDFERVLRGAVRAATWQVTCFPWDVDPREDLEAWRKLTRSPRASRIQLDRLQLPFGSGGPAALGLTGEQVVSDPGRDRFGLIAETTLPLPAGTWQVTTHSDDGVRVRVDDETVIENWTWHAPTRDAGTFTLATPRSVTIVVEYFELDGYATLSFELNRAAPTSAPNAAATDDEPDTD